MKTRLATTIKKDELAFHDDTPRRWVGHLLKVEPDPPENGNVFEKKEKFLAIFWQSNGNFPEGQGRTTFLEPETKDVMVGLRFVQIAPNETNHGAKNIMKLILKVLDLPYLEAIWAALESNLTSKPWATTDCGDS